jgi:hypothetical protein
MFNSFRLRAVIGAVVLAVGLQSGDALAQDPAPTPVPDLTALGTASAVGSARIYHVRPGRAIHIRVAGVGTISGARRTVTRRGWLRVQRYLGQLNTVTSAGMGIDVALRGTRLRKPLTLIQPVTARPPGSIPVFAHRGNDGTWDLKPAKLDSKGRIVIHTRTFSINLPSWLNPKTYVEAIGNWAAQFFGGRTSPVTCPNAAPSWLTVSNLTVSAHACGQNNPDGATERGELRIKNNRGAVQQVTLAGNRAFTYVEGQPDKLRAAIGALTGTDPSNTVFLSPGDGGYLTVGYTRPAANVTYTTLVETTYRSLFLNFAYIGVNFLGDVGSDKSRWVATVKLAQDCLGVYDIKNGTVKDPRTALNAKSFADIFQCVLFKGGEELADPKKAFAAAMELTDGKMAGLSTKQLTDELTKIGGRLRTVGAVFKVLAFLPILQQTLQGPIDVLGALISGGNSTHIDVALQAKPQQAPTTTTTPSTTTPTETTPTTTTTPPGGGTTTPTPTTRPIVVDNRVTNGASQMREDTPSYLSTVTRNYCKRDGCALSGTDMGSGNTITAECTVLGDRTTNGQDNSSVDDGNPGLYSSTRWYGIRWGDGRFGYISEVWIATSGRGGLGLRSC